MIRETLTKEQIQALHKELMDLEDYLTESKNDFKEGNVSFKEVIDDVSMNIRSFRHTFLEDRTDDELIKLTDFIKAHSNEIIGIFLDNIQKVNLDNVEALIHTTWDVLKRYNVEIHYDNITWEDQCEAIQPLLSTIEKQMRNVRS